jgi:tRNA pseudouridine32 synthase/23S rRNA pseudouridine746 synthase
MTVEILFADSDLVVVNKPGGLLAVPGRGPEKQDCVSTRVREIFTDMMAQPAVHRLDMFTSGLMVLAMNREAHRHLSIQFEKREISKQYQAIVEGRVAGLAGEIQLSFRLDPDNRPRQVYDPQQGKMGHTLWKKLSMGVSTTRLQLIPITGRTHQLRLHCAHPQGLGKAIIGDSLYGSGVDGDQMMLHATALEFSHPRTGIRQQYHCQPPF